MNKINKLIEKLGSSGTPLAMKSSYSSKSPSSSAAVREVIKGKEYLIAKDATLVRDGVWNRNNDGKGVLIDKESLQKSVHSFDGSPILMNHVTRESRAKSRHGIGNDVGNIYNAKYVENNDNNETRGNIVADLYLDVNKLQSKGHSDLINRIETGEQINLSMGSFDITPTQVDGVFRGKEYKIKTGTMNLDHLALLAFDKGACSTEDGCGVNLQAPDDLLDDGFLELSESDSDVSPSNSCEEGCSCQDHSNHETLSPKKENTHMSDDNKEIALSQKVDDNSKALDKLTDQVSLLLSKLTPETPSEDTKDDGSVTISKDDYVQFMAVKKEIEEKDALQLSATKEKVKEFFKLSDDEVEKIDTESLDVLLSKTKPDVAITTGNAVHNSDAKLSGMERLAQATSKKVNK